MEYFFEGLLKLLDGQRVEKSDAVVLKNAWERVNKRVRKIGDPTKQLGMMHLLEFLERRRILKAFEFAIKMIECVKAEHAQKACQELSELMMVGVGIDRIKKLTEVIANLIESNDELVEQAEALGDLFEDSNDPEEILIAIDDLQENVHEYAIQLSYQQMLDLLKASADPAAEAYLKFLQQLIAENDDGKSNNKYIRGQMKRIAKKLQLKFMLRGVEELRNLILASEWNVEEMSDLINDLFYSLEILDPVKAYQLKDIKLLIARGDMARVVKQINEFWQNFNLELASKGMEDIELMIEQGCSTKKQKILIKTLLAQTEESKDPILIKQFRDIQQMIKSSSGEDLETIKKFVREAKRAATIKHLIKLLQDKVENVKDLEKLMKSAKKSTDLNILNKVKKAKKIVKNDLMEVVQELKRFGDSVKACEAELILDMFTNGEQIRVIQSRLAQLIKMLQHEQDDDIIKHLLAFLVSMTCWYENLSFDN